MLRHRQAMVLAATALPLPPWVTMPSRCSLQHQIQGSAWQPQGSTRGGCQGEHGGSALALLLSPAVDLREFIHTNNGLSYLQYIKPF